MASINKKKITRKNILESDLFLPYLFIAPSVLLITIFLFYPVANVFYYSLQSYNANKPWANGFIGLDNFVKIFTKDMLFRSSLIISLKWVVSEVLLQLIFGMIIALMLNKAFRFRGLVRTIMFYPWAISGVLTAMMWSLMYNQHIGVINSLLMNLGIIKSNVAWLANIKTVFPSVILAELWRGIPFFAIMILAKLQSIPDEICEACDVDGARAFQKFWYITLPYLKDSIVLATLLRTVWEFNSVDLIMNLTGGGPANATTTLSMYIVDTANRDMDFGYGSSLAVISFCILLCFAIVYLKLSNFEQED